MGEALSQAREDNVMSEILRGEAITVQFGGVMALKSVSFTVDQGSVLGLIGPNGAGKTTLLNAISGLVRPQTGRILLDERQITGQKAHVIARRGVARTFQIVQPFRNLTVLQNVAVGAMFCAKDAAGPEAVMGAAKDALSVVGITEKASYLPSQLTLSERKRLEFARALATRPRVLLLDEVMAGLNHSEIDRMIALIGEIRQTGLTIIVVEHVMKAILAVCDRLLVLHFGEKLAEGPALEVVNDPRVVSAYLGERFAKRHAESWGNP